MTFPECTPCAQAENMTEPTDSSLDGVAPAGGDRPHDNARLDPQRPAATETLARIGACLGAQRVELYRRSAAHVRLDSWWAVAAHLVVSPEVVDPIAVNWFPWTLGNLRQARHVFVRNAGELRLRPGQTATIADLQMRSALHLVVHNGTRNVGALCAYWANERVAWRDELADPVSDLALDVLGPFR